MVLLEKQQGGACVRAVVYLKGPNTDFWSFGGVCLAIKKMGGGDDIRV